MIRNDMLTSACIPPNPKKMNRLDRFGFSQSKIRFDTENNENPCQSNNDSQLTATNISHYQKLETENEKLKYENQKLNEKFSKLTITFVDYLKENLLVRKNYEAKIKLLKNDLKLTMNKITKIQKVVIDHCEEVTKYRKEKEEIESKF